MASLVGMGTAIFDSIALTYKAEDGITESGPTTVAVEDTPDAATSDTATAGDVVNHGTVSMVAIADDTIAVEDIVGTTGSLAITYVLAAGGTTAKTKTGSAICTAAARTSAKNTLNTYAMEWTWADKPTTVPAA